MLVLSRKKSEVVRINHNIEIEVLEIIGGRVRLGIRAPREVPVHRGEVYKSIIADYSLVVNKLESVAKTKNVGLWIDHRKAIIVSVSKSGENVQTIESGVEKHLRSASGSRHKDSDGPQNSGPDDASDRKFTQHLNTFYKEVIDAIKDADAVLILGPGEAKLELKKQINSKMLLARVSAVETADKMTDRQLSAKVRNFFQTTTAAK